MSNNVSCFSWRADPHCPTTPPTDILGQPHVSSLSPGDTPPTKPRWCLDQLVLMRWTRAGVHSPGPTSQCPHPGSPRPGCPCPSDPVPCPGCHMAGIRRAQQVAGRPAPPPHPGVWGCVSRCGATCPISSTHPSRSPERASSGATGTDSLSVLGPLPACEGGGCTQHLPLGTSSHLPAVPLSASLPDL